MARRSLRPQLNQIRAWVRQGRTDAWVAHQLEVTVQEIQQFKRQNDLTTDAMAGEPVFRPGGLSYLRIPAPDPRGSAAFYAAVFGWTVNADRDHPSFEDATGHVIGHFMADLPVAGEAGVLPYVFVESVD